MTKTFEVGRYLCHRVLGSGGMARIYQARLVGAHEFSKEVAIKLMHRHLATNRSIVNLFVNEARITAGLDHPNIVTVFELGEHEGNLFMVMELVDGQDLNTLLARQAAAGTPLPWEVAVAVAIEVAGALQFVHACAPGRAGVKPPVIHRDLSPGNVMVSRSGAVKLLDFGVAKTLLGDDDTDAIARGKWHYMSPEQVRGEQLDGRSDLFSLGAVLFELLTGRQAFRGQTVVDSMRKVEQADLPPAPDIEPALEEILNKLLARDRADRYADASEALRALSQVMMLRGKTTGERDIATLLQTLGDAPAKPRLEMPSQPPLPVTQKPSFPDTPDSTDVQTIPQRDADAHAPSPGLGDEDEELTVPPDAPRGERERSTAIGTPRAKIRAGGPSAAGEPLSDHALTEATDEQLTNPTGDRIGRRRFVTPVQSHPDTEVEETAETSQPQVYFDHFMPPDTVEEVTLKPRIWTGRNLVVLGLAILAILIAGLAILLAIKQQRDRTGRSTDPRRTMSATARNNADAAVRPRSAGAAVRPRNALDAGARLRSALDAGARPRSALDAKVSGSGSRDAGAARPRTPPPRPAVTALPIHGRPGQGELDVITTPKNVRIFVNGVYRGRSQGRVKVRPGRRYTVALSHPGRGLYKTRLWMPAAVGRRLKIMMPFLPRRPKVARPGRTAIRVTCKTKGLHRVYLNTKDTGYDCPTPPLAVLPVIHGVSIYLVDQRRTVWKKIRPKPRTTAVVEFPH